jgi:hypothetical protein
MEVKSHFLYDPVHIPKDIRLDALYSIDRNPTSIFLFQNSFEIYGGLL